MSRPRLPIGTFGDIWFISRPNNRVEARANMRDWDGVTRPVQATAATKRAAEAALKVKLAERTQFQPSNLTLTPDSPFTELVTYWLEDLELEDHLAKATKQLYERNMRTLVLPAFKDFTLREIGVARCDRHIKQLARQSYNRAKQARNVMRLAFGLAVRHEVLPRNPMDGIAKLRKPQHTPDALTPAEVNAVRAAIAHWETGLSSSGPKPDGQLGQIVEVLLGTSSRIGEALAFRRMDVDVASAVPTMEVAGTIVCPKGEPVQRQDHPKTSKSKRTAAIPSFTAEAVRSRLSKLTDTSREALLFCSREGTPLSPANVRRQLRQALNLAGLSGITPHMFRRTVATAVSEAADVELAAELLGHTDPRITIQHYIRRNQMVNAKTAEILESAFAKPE
ncbi:tyrosine-type recombinase/integrase [Leucobacter sp. cx-328]|uniref:Site-specific integrase n=1 Tax=Gulosibacter macacae TaxID=2488791 RepID=A0A3P3VUG3_9MICO|nr:MULTISPECIES: tyrosine-type recombinase/integrase [Microbacteriaceae]MBC9943150.1 tyrosine-type recombinase/integrase [Leucobacter sp. cx-328]MBL5974525.1 site-specific integrase [Candidatus Leucobacter sulfamidivorax]RRJ85628.1 site-specific integrase [Gulosibacter macacae]